MDCEWVELLLLDYLEGACVEPLQKKIERHLAACARCRAARDAAIAVESRLAGVSVPEAPVGLTDEAMRRIARSAIAPAGASADKPAAPIPRWRDLRSLAAAAAVLAGALGTYRLLSDQAREYLPEARIVADVTGAVSRTGESFTKTVLDYARERLSWTRDEARPR
jgi:hypothetical protein